MSVGHKQTQLTVVHLDDHAAHPELPAARLEAQRDGLRVLVAETLEDAVSLLDETDPDCLVAGLAGPDYDAPDVVCSRARAAVSDLPIVFFEACEPDAVIDALDPETSFVPREGGADDAAGDAVYGMLANRVESLVPRSHETSVFDPLAEEVEALLDGGVPACVLRGEAITYHNDAFAEAFDVGAPPIRAERVLDAVVEGEGDLRALLEPPTDGTTSVAVEYPGGGQRRVEVTAASDGGAVLAQWADRSGSDPDRPSREESMLRSLLEGIPVSVYFKDQQSRHVRVSDALIGMSAESYLANGEGKRHPTPADAVGKTDFDLYHGDHASLTVEDDRQVMETERPIELKEEYTRSDTDEDIWLLTCKAPWYGPDGEVAGVAGITVDVTEQKLNRREEAPLEGRLDQFERVLTTTFRDELQAAIDTVEHARERHAGGPSDEVAFDDAIEDVAGHLDVLEGLLGDAMTLARYTRVPAERTSIDLGSFLRTVWADVDPKRGELVVEADAVVFADEEQLHCLLRNLFEVALHHGGPGVTVEVGGLEDGFYLERDGPPLTPEQRDGLMEGRVDDDAESLGLAMTIVVGIADANGWESSVSGGGRRFEFTGVELR